MSTLSFNVIDADDNFGFNEVSSFFEDAKSLDPVTGEDV